MRKLLGIIVLALIGMTPELATAATNLIKLGEVNAGISGSFPSNFVTLNGEVLFSAYSVQVGAELWRWDGTNVTLATNINDTVDEIFPGIIEGNSSVPNWLTPFRDSILFSAFDPRRGGELWAFNGTNATRVADIAPDANNEIKSNPFNSWPYELTVLNNVLYFAANSSTSSVENYELWRYDGATASRVANIRPDIGTTNASSYPNNLSVFAGKLFFMADDGANGYELWRHNGNTTILLTNINPGGPSSSSYPKLFTPFRDHLYFQAYHDSLGYELWRTDGTNVSLVQDILPGFGSSYAEQFLVYKDALYFRASDSFGAELWRFDGTNAIRLTDLSPGDFSPKNLTQFGELLMFAADDGVNGWELWAFDGTNANLVTNLNEFGNSYPEQLTVVGNRLYFVAETPEAGYEIWEFDGTNAIRVTDINPQSGSSYPQHLSAIGDRLYFSATEDGYSNWEPWSLQNPRTEIPQPWMHEPTIHENQLLLNVNSTAGITYVLERTTDFQSWEPVATNVAASSSLAFSEEMTSGQSFYRVVAR